MVTGSDYDCGYDYDCDYDYDYDYDHKQQNRRLQTAVCPRERGPGNAREGEKENICPRGRKRGGKTTETKTKTRLWPQSPPSLKTLFS